jgi:hypothetical protein
MREATVIGKSLGLNSFLSRKSCVEIVFCSIYAVEWQYFCPVEWPLGTAAV